MPKHNQTKSLGSLTDLQSAPQPIPETTDERIDRLERRLSQVESLLNDVTQQLDKPYRNQQHGNGKPKQAKLKQAKPNPKKAKKAPTPPTPALTKEETQVNDVAIIAFLSQDPDKLWHGAKLRIAIQELCDLSNQQVVSSIKRLRSIGHLVIVKDVEVDGNILKGAYQFIQQPEPAEQVKQEKQEKVIALEKAQQAAAAQLTAETFEKLQALLATGDRINSEELQAAGINKKQQKRIRKSDAYKESGIQYKKMPDETYEYSLEPTS